MLQAIKLNGRSIILDGHQAKLRQLDWLMHFFREPYSKAYAAESVTAWLQQAEFTQFQTNQSVELTKFSARSDLSSYQPDIN